MTEGREGSGGGCTSKVLLGCGIGCLLLVVLAAVGGVAVYRGIVKPVAEATEQFEHVETETRRVRADVVDLDGRFPPRVADDLAAADLTVEDLDRYLAVRAELAPHVAKVSEAWGSFSTALPGGIGSRPGFGSIVKAARGMVEGMGDLATGRLELLRAAKASLESAGMGPTDLARIAEVVEWRFLMRPEALALGVPAYQQGDYWGARFQVQFLDGFAQAAPGGAFGVSESDREEMARQAEEAKRRLADIEADARANTALSEATRAFLETRRAELEALPATGVAFLATLTDASPLPMGPGAGGWTPSPSAPPPPSAPAPTGPN